MYLIQKEPSTGSVILCRFRASVSAVKECTANGMGVRDRQVKLIDWFARHARSGVQNDRLDDQNEISQPLMEVAH